MSDGTILQRAHDLSAKASVLLGPAQPASSTLQEALGAYREAAGLFETAAQEAAGDASAKRTLQLLATQHRKLAKDLERRINTSASGSGPGAVITAPPPRLEAARRNTEPVQPRDGMALGLGAIGRQAWPPPGVATRLSPARGLPPFAMRPAIPEGTTIDAQTPAPPSRVRPDHAISPLHSSSSSSGTEPGESYINFGAVPDTLDPFSRFWGKLDNMLDDISNPVAFATASMVPGVVTAPLPTGKPSKREKTKTIEQREGKIRADSPSESFYLVNKQNVPDETTHKSTSRTSSPTEKTPEELALENENLRASLDAIASHAQSVEHENKRLKAEAEARNVMMKSAILEVRREAQKAKHGQDLMRSQMMGSISSPFPRGAPRLEGSRHSAVPNPHDLIVTQRRRIDSLEEELRLTKLDNEKNKEAAAKYKERLDKIKANAKLKKEAKMTGNQEPPSRG